MIFEVFSLFIGSFAPRSTISKIEIHTKHKKRHNRKEAKMCRNYLSMLMLGIILVVGATLGIQSCGSSKTTTPDSEKYLSEYHEQYFGTKVDIIEGNKLALYVDYSTCIALGQSSSFFKEMLPSISNATKDYFSIEGNSFIQHSADSTYNLLRIINDVDYADLKTAVEQMANRETESLLLTDGEYFQKNATKDNLRNPYMADAFKKWLLRGHDIYIISEPYVESYNGKQFNKKRFYIIFTDNRLSGNFYDRIMQSAKLQNFPEVELFHLSADHPALLSLGGNHSSVNTMLSAKVSGKGGYEIQSWPLDWKNGIEPLIVNAVNQQTGEPLPNGEPILNGIKVDRNSLGAFRITGVAAKVYNINAAYAAYTEAKEAKVKPDLTGFDPWEVENFIRLDEKEFDKHGEVALYFDQMMYDPSSLDGAPYNYTKIDICVNKVEPIFDQYADKFEFQSITMPDEPNVSISASIKQCMTDPDVQQKVTKAPIYTIYVKSFEY